LNALDGVASGEERIIFMTTNHLEKLDPALIRPGRVDMLELVNDASPAQARHLYEQFYKGEENISEGELQTRSHALESLVEKQVEGGNRVSMAALQGLFIRSNSVDAIQDCEKLFVPRNV
jgi:mitochondrial chaperone BCS1